MGPEQIALLGSAATISVIHTLLPSHWLCFSLVGRANRWPLRRTLGVTAIAGLSHVLSTTLLGVAAVFAKRTWFPHETYEFVSAVLLLAIGSFYLLLHFLHRGHRHSHDQGSVSTFLLILLPTLSPCTAVIPMFLAVARGGALFLAIAAGLLTLTTLGVMLLLVTLSSLGIERLHFSFLDRYEKAIIGSLLLLLGLSVILFSHR